MKKPEKEIKHYVSSHHPLLNYIEKLYFPDYNDTRLKQLDFAIKQKQKGIPGLTKMKPFRIDLERTICFAVTLVTKFYKKVENDCIIIVETNSLLISSNDVFGYTLSDTGNLICLGSNNYPYNEKYKKDITDFLFGKFNLNKKLNDMPVKKKEKIFKI